MRYRGVEGESLPTARKSGTGIDILDRVAVRRGPLKHQAPFILEEGLCSQWHRMHELIIVERED